MSKELTPLEALERVSQRLCGDYNDCSHELAVIETTLNENIELKKCIDLIGDIETNNKKLKVLEIIKEKQVNVEWLLETENVEEYNESLYADLTQEEYDLLKEVLL